MQVDVERLVKRYGKTRALDGVSFGWMWLVGAVYGRCRLDAVWRGK